ncbi:energy-coupling factor transporter transmembrane component T [Ellagibacter isourolithinifaciens]|uniref:energy-coupling factor transporter transmembrane component T n=1 Tax=Ellagibacter isourolithinifaciens TaxID=2137581 RepID=UPI003A8D3910
MTAQLLVASGSTLLSPFAASLLMYRHVLPAFMFAFNMIATTRLGELACALQAIRVPANVSVAVCVAFRFLPTMGREFSAVADAMKTRGIALTPKSVVCHPAKTAEHFLVPVIARLGQIADELGNAVVVRGVGASAHRTSYYHLRVRAIDVVCLIAAMALLAFAVCLRAGVL